MKNNLVELVFILDMSGSMAGLTDNTIGGFNSMIDEQKTIEGKVIVSTVLFNDESEVLHNRVSLDKIQHLTKKEYRAGGCTALLDAVGGAIHHIGSVQKYAGEDERADKVMFVITTDGYENASHDYTYNQVRSMIERQKEKYGWQFIFMGANIDAVDTARKFGIDEDHAGNFMADEQGVKCNYSAMNYAVRNYRECGKVDKEWKKQMEMDYKKRSKK